MGAYTVPLPLVDCYTTGVLTTSTEFPIHLSIAILFDRVYEGLLAPACPCDHPSARRDLVKVHVRT